MNLYIKEAEQRLKASLPTLEKARDAIGIHFSFSNLNAESSDEHCSIAINVLRDQFKNAIGDIYSFKNRDIVIVYRGRSEKLILDCLSQVQYLFSDDSAQLPLAEDFIDRYSQVFYPKDWPKFLGLCDALTKKMVPDNQNSPSFKGSLVSLFSSIIEDLLVSVDWGILVKTSAITKQFVDETSSKVFDEIYADVDSLSYIIGENFDIVGNPHLRAYFKEFLDIKLLLRLVELLNKKPGENAYLLNLNITTIASHEFWVLAESLPDVIKRRIIIAISVADVFNDLAYFLEVRERLIFHGFKLALDCLDYLSFMQIDRSSLGFDLVRIKHKTMFDVIKLSEQTQELVAKISISGTSRVILEVADKEAMRIGQKLGIMLFQLDK